MRLSRLEIQNYKSLRDVVIEPGPLSVFVGPNAAGKSNLADAIDFLGDVYRWGLEPAVARKGGYENICFRQSRRSRAPIRFRIVLEGPQRIQWLESRPKSRIFDLTLSHTFEFRSRAQGIQSPFSITAEELVVSMPAGEILRISREAGRPTDVRFGIDSAVFASGVSVALVNSILQSDLGTSAIALHSVWSILRWLRLPFRVLESGRAFRLTPHRCRESGIPTPNPELDHLGGNLPAVVDYLKGHHSAAYASFLEAAMQIVPSIEDITTGFTHMKTLGLFVKERNFDRPWPAADLSDGTIQTLGLLAAIFDPRTGLAVIEEPENSIHPWAIRNLVQAARKAAEKKQIFFTTHSPIVINQLKPKEIWVVQRPSTETKIDPLLKLDPSLQQSWRQGEFLLSEYLDSGAVPEAVPTIRS